ncbi:MAG TPA: adenosylmethionine decarboxylase [Anaerolineaceae bacterium]|nr:adenosylmethionine decarboxylase [Anaerolineaceae bacterium]
MSNFLKLGEHFICELVDCDQTILLDNPRVRTLFVQAARETGLSIVGEGQFEFSPHGFTLYLLLQESHASIHVWPEYSYCAVDLFTCDLSAPANSFFEQLKLLFEAGAMHVQMIERGIPATIELPAHSGQNG